MPKAPSKKKVPVDFGADQDFLISGITADVTTLECIYDLIDNSIDAARNDLLSVKEPKLDEYGLPQSYAGYEVSIVAASDSFSIHDNCSGMSEATLSRKSFKTGSKSSHPFGIGHFGIGLNRSVFKLGRTTTLISDDGKTHLTLSFTEQQIRASEGKDIFAVSTTSKGKKKNYLKIADLRPEIAHDFKSLRWQESMKKNVKQRYGRFILKGLRLLVDDVQVQPFHREIQRHGFFPPVVESAKLANEVMFYLEAGVHEQYDSSPGAGAGGKNKNLSQEYGWYVVCNDRTILVEDRSPITGWGAWHPEYNGFIGWAHYVSERPEFLPWDSKKTGINTHSPAYTASIDLFTRATRKFRTANRKRLKSNSELKAKGTKNGGSAATGSGRYEGTDDAKTVPGRRGTDRLPITDGRSHTSGINTVFVRCNVKSNKPKIASLVIEAANTPIPEFPYRAALMLRTLFEHALRDYLARHNHFKKVKDHSVKVAEEKLGRALNPDEIKKRRIEMDDALAWAVGNSDIWPEGSDKATCKRSCTNYQRHLKRLNGVVHEAGELIEESDVVQMRNDVMTALVIMLEH